MSTEELAALADDEELNIPDVEIEEELQDPPEPSDDPQPEISQSEQKARSRGWRPKDEYEGNPEDWLDHKTYLVKGELLDDISQKNRVIKALERKLGNVTDYVKGMDERNRKAAIEKLKEEQRAAVADGDTAAYDKYEEAIAEASKPGEHKLEDEPENTEPEIRPELIEFKNRNNWFETDEDLTEYAMFRAERLLKKHDLNTTLSKIEAEVKQRFPEKFTNPNKKRAAVVMNGGQPSRTGKLKISDLTPEQRDVWNVLQHTMTEEEYLKDLEKANAQS